MMTDINEIFIRLEQLIKENGQVEFGIIFQHKCNINDTDKDNNVANTTEVQWNFLRNIINEINKLSFILNNDNSILVSVKNQKHLRTCFQMITSLGLSQCLIPGVGISLNKRCSTSASLPSMNLQDDQKYQLLVECTDFFTASYNVPVLKSIIITFHLSDYLAALIQLSFAPLKKPGTYTQYVMTQDRYGELLNDRQKYLHIYDNLVSNCFQPILMKELLVLQSVTDPQAPNFVKRVVAKEMSQRLLAPDGLLSLIRCFLENYGIDTGYDWKKIDMICKIIVSKHGNYSELDYLTNISRQITKILLLNNVHYLLTAMACIHSLNEKYPHSEQIKALMEDMFQSFNYEHLKSISLPGTVIMTGQEIEHKINLLHVNLCTGTKLNWPTELWFSNIPIVFQLGLMCSKSEEITQKIKAIVIKSLEVCHENDLIAILYKLLFGSAEGSYIAVCKFEAGLLIKSTSENIMYPCDKALEFFIEIYKLFTNTDLIKNVFRTCLQMLINVTVARGGNNKELFAYDNEPLIVHDIDEQYYIILQLLSEIINSTKVISSLKEDPLIILEFLKHFLLKKQAKADDECITISLVLLNTILSNTTSKKGLLAQYVDIIPFLKDMANTTSSHNSILCKEILSMMSNNTVKINTACTKAIEDIFDDLLPVRAHGIMELTKLIDAKDSETISKKHFIFCLLQEKLKDKDSYIYLSAVNGLAALGTHCTEDILHVLCKEFLNVSNMNNEFDSEQLQQRTIEVRLKIGDIIVKVTKHLGEMAIVHKAILLNTVLCACRDPEPLIRTSALSNLSEIVLVLNYKLGNIIYEVLLCIWGILESDKAIECRRAAVMVISSLLKGLGKETLIQLKENLLPIYRTLKNLYNNPIEDSILRLHAQLALEELNDIVTNFLFSELNIKKSVYVLDKLNDSY